ncbi:hypothetical protein PENTCL1PPCAC_3507 [Pristionchus entomophagus]|uniref:Uncharacterized protein n=1 Tax=Pristionchus entomophagus TaxID=358040 RepID=A0AAV5SFE6_9BILA|nr:hypothetical protein PENTCL1PPCAC_3507 [Pristionchus entomophagus]
MREFHTRCGEDPDKILSLSSLKRGWSTYLTDLDVPADQFVCPECGLFPDTLVFDATTIGTRGDLGSYSAKRDTTRLLSSHSPGWLGNKEMRSQMREFAINGTPVTSWVPPEFSDLLYDSLLQDGSCDMRFRPFFKWIFADSPISDVLKVIYLYNVYK